MTSAQVVETSVNVITNSPSQDYTHPDDRTLLYDMTPGFKPFTILCLNVRHLRKKKKCFRISQDLTVTLDLRTRLNLFCPTSIENFLPSGIALRVNQVLLCYRETKTRPSAHKLQVEDEFLMVPIKLRMGLSNIDLGERFNLSDSAVSNILLTWLNYIYEVLGSLKIWPHRDFILKNAPQEFIDKYPNNTVIIDATELKIQVPSALQKHSESYSSYKLHTTSKSLIGVDPNGGIMFISQLYEGSISDKQIVKR